MKKVSIFTSDSCHFCHEAKDFLVENNIEFTEHNISTDVEAKRALMKKGYRAVPVIVIDEEEMVGFDKEKVAGLLGL